MRPTPRLRIASAVLPALGLFCLNFLSGCAGLELENYGNLDPVWAPSPGATQLSEPIPLTLQNLTVPGEHGEVKEVWDSESGGPIVLHVQDANAVYVAQKHSAAILDHLIRQHGLYLVLVEGGSRNDSISHLRVNAPIGRRQQIAEEFLRSGKISGENYLDLTTDYNFLVYGIEKPELYDRNMQALLDLQKLQPEALAAIRKFQQAANSLKQRLYPQEVQAWEAQEREQEAGRIALDRHYQNLAEEAGKRNILVTAKDYPNLRSFLDAVRLEKELDLKSVEASFGELDSELNQTGPDAFLQQYLDHKAGRISLSQLQRDLHARIKPEQLTAHPVLAEYLKYLDLFKAIDHAALFTEVSALTDQIKASYFNTQEEKELASLSKNLVVLEDLIRFKLTPDTHAFFVQHKEEFKPEVWVSQLRMLAAKQDPALAFALDPDPLVRAMPVASDSYEAATQRTQAMSENALMKINEYHVPFAVLIAGGFHTPTLTRQFKEQKISYAVIAPRVGRRTVADDRRYQKVIAETYQPMSKEYREKLKEPSTVAAAASNE